MLKLYNTLSKTIEEVPKQRQINLYTCGPTVYNFAHIGNLRSYVEADLVYRTLSLLGYNVKWVMNITDVDDKTIKNTIEQVGPQATVADLKKFTEKFYQDFLKDLDETNISRSAIQFVKVTDVIPQIQDFILKLMGKGYAYKAEDGSTYFSIEKYQKDFGDYGQLVGEKFLEGKKVGARVNVDEYDKENLSDFALWKAHGEDDGQIFWDHEKLGKGRPGWHIECSVINHIAFGGEPTDIHTGGVDLIFPHHTNEIAQSQALLGKGNFVHHWLHSEHLLVDGKKMSKSAGNFYTLQDLHPFLPVAGLALKYLFLQSGYRTQQNFTKESFTAAYKVLERLFNSKTAHQFIGDGQKLQAEEVKKRLGALRQNLGNDLNSASALAELNKIVGSDELNISTQDEVIKSYEQALGLKLDEPPSIVAELEIPAEVKKLLDDRQAAKAARNFKKSDDLRIQIETAGFEVMDTPEGQKVKKKIKI